MFQSNRRAERQYYVDILGILRRYFNDPMRVGYISLPDWVNKFAQQAATRMITHQMALNARSWKAAAREGGEGQRIYAALQSELRNTNVGARYRELIAENAQYIKTLPEKVASQFVKEAARLEREGVRAESIQHHKLLGHLLKWQAMRLARTESAKANAALTQARAEDLGLDWYVWRTSEDERVRLSHRKMDGVLVSFDDPPSPEQLVGMRSYGHYQAGNIFNCRCYIEPLLSLRQVNWPHKVYAAGVIRYQTLAEFRSRNITAARAA